MKRGVLLIPFLILLVAAACSPSPRDVVPESRDVRIQPGMDAGGGQNPDAYVYVARRAHAVVALAEARNMTEGDAKQIVDDWDHFWMNRPASDMTIWNVRSAF